jgi:hypothetical protein
MVFKREKQFLRFFAACRAAGLAKADPFAVCLCALCSFAAISVFALIFRLRIRRRKICGHFLAYDPDIQDIRCDRRNFFAGEKRAIGNDS